MMRRKRKFLSLLLTLAMLVGLLPATAAPAKAAATIYTTSQTVTASQYAQEKNNIFAKGVVHTFQACGNGRCIEYYDSGTGTTEYGVNASATIAANGTLTVHHGTDTSFALTGNNNAWILNYAYDEYCDEISFVQTHVDLTVSVTGVTVNPTSATLTIDQTQQLNATVSPSNATNKNVSWSSGNTIVATVSSSGLVTAKGAGSTTITVRTTDGSGKVTIKGAGSATIRATVTDSATYTYANKTAQYDLTVAPAALTATADNKTITYGDAAPEYPYLFPSPVTGDMYYPDAIAAIHTKILRTLGLEHTRFHALRHTFASVAFQNGVDIRTVSGMLGHADPGFTLRTYTHTMNSMQERAAETMGAVMAQNL